MNTPKPKNPSAFPASNDEDKMYNYCERGMTLRDYFAGQFIAGYCGTIIEGQPVGDQDPADEAARIAYRVADSLLAFRQNGQGDSSAVAD